MVVQPAGGTSRRKAPLPQYYSRQIYDSGKIQLPQEPQSHEVAIQVLDDAKELETRIKADDSAFKEMLEVVEHLQKQIAVYVESRQIYDIICDIELRIRLKQEAEEEEEFLELMAVLDE